MRPQQIGGLHALALQTRANGVGVQVMPAGYGDGDLVISDGVTKGRGTVHRREEVAPASRDSFESITYFGAEQKERAARDVAAMRYVLSGSGLQPVYAKTSETVRRRDGFVSLDARVLNAEMSAQAIMRTLRELDGEVGALEVAK
ncbi:MAG TPA: hypothetical protein VNI01_05450 [Elusimicrobiota bacterium]|jgi:hypothetical protein|nr:hypothetical protein [Elusimicrobiota bacterium]